ncbi:MAG: hypothetical protein OEY14_02750 [Myxococcales bacterium]|nr:hypothetical protein [Myxococcales bacterium]
MARTRKTAKPTTRRGSPEAVEKRRVARRLNDLLMGGAKKTAKLDGRSEKRRLRLVQEMKEGKGGVPLKPIQFLLHANEVLELGESISTLRKQGIKARKFERNAEIDEYVARTQAAYGFKPQAWRLLGLSLPSAEPEAEPAPRRKASTKPKKGKARKARS